MPTQIALVATAASLGLLVLAWMLRSRETDVGGRALLSQLLAAASAPAALWTAMLMAGKDVAFPPAVFHHWLLLGAAASAIAGLCAGGGAARRVLAMGLVAGSAYVVFHRGTGPLHDRDFGGAVVRWAGALAGMTVLAAHLRLGASRNGNPARAVEGLLGFALASLAASPMLYDAGLSVGSIAAASLSGGAGLFGLLLVARARVAGPDALRGVPGLARAAGVAQAACLCLLVAWGLLFAYEGPPRWAAALLVLAPFATLLPFGSSLPAALARLTLVALIAGAAPLAPELSGFFGGGETEAPADGPPSDTGYY